MSDAGIFCENATVKWLYSPAVAGSLFYYDMGLKNADFFDDTTKAMSGYLNRPDVKAALHVGDSTWVQADE